MKLNFVHAWRYLAVGPQWETIWSINIESSRLWQMELKQILKAKLTWIYRCKQSRKKIQDCSRSLMLDRIFRHAVRERNPTNLWAKPDVELKDHASTGTPPSQPRVILQLHTAAAVVVWPRCLIPWLPLPHPTATTTAPGADRPLRCPLAARWPHG